MVGMVHEEAVAVAYDVLEHGTRMADVVEGAADELEIESGGAGAEAGDVVDDFGGEASKGGKSFVSGDG